MSERLKAIQRMADKSDINSDTYVLFLALTAILEVQEEILEELRVQNDVDDEEQGHTSLSDQ